jgi:4-amino-4-deoxy-L-arabinose transferase-like glycosyltransferase
MFELIVGENFIKRSVPRGDRVRQTAATSANPTTSIDQTTPPELGRDYVPAGPLRLAMAPLAAQIGWLLAVALIGGFAAWRRYRGSLGHERLMLLLWAGGLIYGIMFSAAAGLFHAYYLAVMAPALCALCRDRCGQPVGAVSFGSCLCAVVSRDDPLNRYLAGSHS